MPVQIRFRPQNLKLLTPIKCDGINLTMKKKVYEKIITHYNKKKHVENTIKIFDSRKKNTELRTRKGLLFFQVYDDTSKKKETKQSACDTRWGSHFQWVHNDFWRWIWPSNVLARKITNNCNLLLCQFNWKINSLQITSTWARATPTAIPAMMYRLPYTHISIVEMQPLIQIFLLASNSYYQ